MALQTGQVTIGTSATLIHRADADGARVYLHDDSNNSIYVGPAGITTSTGYELNANAAVNISLEANESIYGVSAAGNDTISYLVSGN